MLRLYIELGICFGVVALIFYLAILLNYILQRAKCYIDDAQYKCEDTLTKIFILKFMSSSDASYAKRGDIEEVTMYAFKVLGLGLIAIIAWPLATVVFIGVGTMKGLRSANRLKKKVSSLSKVAHKHLDEVNIEEFKDK